MRTYWDSSALVEAVHNEELRSRLKTRQDGTRVHTLAEIFSTLTKGVVYRYSPDDAAKIITDLSKDLDFVELSAADGLLAVNKARRLGVRGARIHDLMHLFAARKYRAEALMTLDTSGFRDIGEELPIQSPV
jgi:predicted nucleic acid-binding protein